MGIVSNSTLLIWTLLACAMIRVPVAGAAVIHVVPDSPLVPPRGNGTELLALDLNEDGVVDFEIIDSQRESDVRTLGTNRILGNFGLAPRIKGLQVGSIIGVLEPPSSVWTESFFLEPPFDFLESIPTLIGCAAGGGETVCIGDFVGATAFAGVEFTIAGATHYGWLRIMANDLSTHTAILDWAYESDPGVPIRAGAIPEPSTGFLVLVGSMLLAIQRRRREI